MKEDELIKTKKSFLNTYSFEENKKLVNKCILEVDSKLLYNPPIILYGKEVIQRRNVGFFSNDSIGYYYSKKLLKSQPLTDNLKELLGLINNFFSCDFNGILINKYKDGSDYVGLHTDDEDNLEDIGIVALSIGAERKFRIRDINSGKKILDVPTKSYHLLQMGGNFQKEFTHEIPVEKKVKDIRFSFTFRKHKL
tara:strand:- start:2566 stop:3150 length:585 start_codon:yes stop_codon:yes gene_type:complete